MINNDHRRYFIAESGDILAKCQSYREEYNYVSKLLWDFTQSIGGTAYTRDAATGRVLNGVRFPKDKVPYGWKTDKEGISRPRYRSEPHKVVGALPKLPDPEEYLAATNFIKTVAWESPSAGTKGTRLIGNPACFTDIAWYDTKGPLLVVLPDQALICAYTLREYPDATFEKNAHLNELNTEGLREILLKEWDLMEEKFKRGMI